MSGARVPSKHWCVSQVCAEYVLWKFCNSLPLFVSIVSIVSISSSSSTTTTIDIYISNCRNSTVMMLLVQDMTTRVSSKTKQDAQTDRCKAVLHSQRQCPQRAQSSYQVLIRRPDAHPSVEFINPSQMLLKMLLVIHHSHLRAYETTSTCLNNS